MVRYNKQRQIEFKSRTKLRRMWTRVWALKIVQCVKHFCNWLLPVLARQTKREQHTQNQYPVDIKGFGQNLERLCLGSFSNWSPSSPLSAKAPN